MITITRDAWKKFAPNCPVAWTEALFSNLDFLSEKGITESELRWCHFAATVWAETGDFKELREDLSYKTAKALRKAWPSRFGHLTDAQCKPYLRNPRALAAKVYNGRMGNRVGSSDGYDFRGGGWIQTTGRSAVAEYCAKLGIQPGANTLDDPLITLQFAVLEWTEKNCNKWADQNEIEKIAKAINTGSADSDVAPNGMDNRRDGFAKAWELWGEYGTADKPAKAISLKAIAGKVGVPAAAVPTTISLLSTPAGEPAAPAATVASRLPEIAPKIAAAHAKLEAAQPKISAALDATEQALSYGDRFRGTGGRLVEFGGFLFGNPLYLVAIVGLLAIIAFMPARGRA